MTLVTSTPDLLRQTHEEAWADKWNSGRMDVEGDDDDGDVVGGDDDDDGGDNDGRVGHDD